MICYVYEGFKNGMLPRKRPWQYGIGSGRYRFYRVNKNHDETPYNRDKTPLRLQKIAVHDNRHRIQIFFQLRFMKIIFLVHIWS